MADDKQELMRQLQRFRDEHRAMDERLRQMLQEAIIDQLAVQSLKKKKLSLKDQIVQLENYLFPNIIA